MNNDLSVEIPLGEPYVSEGLNLIGVMVKAKVRLYEDRLSRKSYLKILEAPAKPLDK